MSWRRILAGATAIAAVLLVAATVVAGGPWALLSRVADVPVLIRARLVPPPAGEEVVVPAEAEERLQGLHGRIDGFVVWASNRDGNHELYRMDLPGQGIRRLTRDSHVDYYGRISPGGESIVFMRSRPRRLSVRAVEGWDIWVMDADGAAPRRLAENGYRPAWRADGDAVFFMRGRSGYRVGLAGGREEKIFEFPDELPQVRYGDIYIDRDASRLSAALSGGVTRIYELPGFREHVLDDHPSCQGLWAPGLDSIVWIQARGEGGTRVMRADPDGSDPRVLIDLPGSHTHEYFPTVSADGRWLVWGATAEGHEHDRADYEIFLWEIGTDPETTMRLTHHTGNDMWPDIWVRPD